MHKHAGASDYGLLDEKTTSRAQLLGRARLAAA